jgi:hypothetical protein
VLRAALVIPSKQDVGEALLLAALLGKTAYGVAQSCGNEGSGMLASQSELAIAGDPDHDAAVSDAALLAGVHWVAGQGPILALR